MVRGRMLCGRSKFVLQCLRRCYRTRRELSSILLSCAIREARFLARSVPYVGSERGDGQPAWLVSYRKHKD